MVDVLIMFFSQKLNRRLALHNGKELPLHPLTFLGVQQLLCICTRIRSCPQTVQAKHPHARWSDYSLHPAPADSCDIPFFLLLQNSCNARTKKSIWFPPLRQLSITLELNVIVGRNTAIQCCQSKGLLQLF